MQRELCDVYDVDDDIYDAIIIGFPRGGWLIFQGWTRGCGTIAWVMVLMVGFAAVPDYRTQRIPFNSF